jgi:hypothetical protein
MRLCCDNSTFDIPMIGVFKGFKLFGLGVEVFIRKYAQPKNIGTQMKLTT